MTAELFDRFPTLRERVGHTPLGKWPTPVDALRLPGGGWVKRDDLAAPDYGGNKVRKLEFLLGEALRQGAGRIVTAGTAGSHHALATAVHGRAVGLPVTVVLCPQPVTEQVHATLAALEATGAELRYASRMATVPPGVALALLAHRQEAPFLVAPGGSDATGTLGYVAGGLELAAQVAAGAAPRPSRIHVAAGTLGTAVGLALAVALAGWDTRVVATRIVPRRLAPALLARRLARRTAALLAPGGELAPVARAAVRCLLFRDGQVGAGYGRATEAGTAAAARFADAGLVLDPTYTAKAAASFLAELDDGGQGAGLLFWHTLSAALPAAPPATSEVARRLLER
jgi:D-cysteine desulfhydrase